MSTRKTMLAAIVAAGMAITAAPASATVLTLDSGWQDFLFAEVGSSWTETFEINLAGDGWLAVTDAFLSGDQFEFFSNGVSLGLTSAPTTQGDQIWADYSGAFADPRWSSAEVMLSAGNYVISGLTIMSPFGGGAAAIQLSSTPLGGPAFEPPPPTSVPTPATSLLLVAGLLGVAAMRPRRSV